MKFLQKLGKAIMLPVAVMPLCGLLMGIGYLLCPASMQGGEITGLLPLIGLYLVKAGGALIDHIALLFAIGVGVGMAQDKDGTAALASLVSWLVITTLLNVDNVTAIMPSLSENASLAFAKIENPFIGILSGLLGAFCYNRFKNTRLPDWLAFFSGKRSTVIIAGGAVRAIMEAVGIRDVLAKAIGTNNPHNVLRATMQGLMSLRSSEEVSALRGKKLEAPRK